MQIIDYRIRYRLPSEILTTTSAIHLRLKKNQSSLLVLNSGVFFKTNVIGDDDETNKIILSSAEGPLPTLAIYKL